MRIRRSLFPGMLAVLATVMPVLAAVQTTGLTIEQRLQRVEDELVREHGQWKILRRVDYPVTPTAAEWMKPIRERKEGRK